MLRELPAELACHGEIVPLGLESRSTVRIEANPTPSVLVWARTSSGFSLEEAAKKIGVPGTRLEEWEAGRQKPTFAQLRKAAVAYRRPLATFYLQEPPRAFQPMHDFRRHPDGDTSFVSPALTSEIRRGYDRREWALELIGQLDEQPKVIPLRLRLDQEVEQAASLVRELLGITVGVQSQWRDQAFKEWRARIEGAGVLTFEMTSIPVEEARGFSIGVTPLPVAVANIKDSPRARVFTLLHEMVHILLESGGICNLDERGRDESAESETFCNQVAGATIFPRDGVLGSDVVRRHAKGQAEWTDQELRSLSFQFGGSREAALVRLASLGLTSKRFCDSRREQFRQEYRRFEADRKAQKDGGFVPPHQLALLSAGPMFVGLVVENFNRERITVSDFSDYLQIRARHITEVQQDYAGFGG